MKLYPTTEKGIEKLNLGFQLIEIRKKRMITFHKLSKYFGVKVHQLQVAHCMALDYLQLKSFKTITDGNGNRHIGYEVMGNFSGYKEPDFMKDAPTQLYQTEPEWMNNLSSEQLLGIFNTEK